MALKPCRECGAQVSSTAETCPHCGVRAPASDDVLPSLDPAPPKKHKSGCAGVLVVLFAIVVIVAISNNGEKAPDEHSACRSEWTRCSDNAELVNHYRGWYKVKAACQSAADKSARYGTPKWPWGAFGTFFTGKNYVSTGKVFAIEPDAQFQNGFGAMVHSQITCSYDLRSEQVLDVHISAK